MRPRLSPRPALVGAAIGAALSLALYVGTPADLTRAAAEGYGTALVLFVVGLPWSVLVLVAGAVLDHVVGFGGPGAVRVLYHLMPVVAGATWGELVAVVRAIRAGNRQARAVRAAQLRQVAPPV